METALGFPPGRPAMALGADPMSAFSLPSPGLGQDTPRFIGERLSPTTVHIGDNISTSSPQRSYSTSSNYFNPIQQQQQQQQQQEQQQQKQEQSQQTQDLGSPQDTPWTATRQHSTTPTYRSTSTSAAPPTTYDLAPTTGVGSPQYKSSIQHEQHKIEQMSVSLNHQVSLGGPASLGHDSLVHTAPFGRHHPHHHDYHQPGRSLYSAPADLYGSGRNTPSPSSAAHGTTLGQQDATSTAGYFSTAMSNHHSGSGSGDGSARSPTSHSQNPYSHHQQQQQQQQQQSHHMHHDDSVSSLHGSLLTSGHGAPSQQPRHSVHDTTSSTAGGAGNSHNSPDMMGYRSQHSPSIPSMGGMPGMSSSSLSSSKMGHTMPGLQMFPPHQPLHQPHQHTDHSQSYSQQSQHSQHQQHQQQTPSHHHALPSPTQQGSHSMRLIPPPLPSQSGLSPLGPPLGSPYSGTSTSASTSGSGAPGGSRGYASYQHHQGVHQPSPHSPGLSGPVISNLNNPNGHLTLVSSLGGMPYGSHSHSAGGGLGSAGLGSARRPLLYSQGQHHGALHPQHLSSTQLGHHHLGMLGGGKGGMGGMGGMGSMGMGSMGIGGQPSVHERPFKCDQCPQSFNRNHDLKRHKRIHLAVKPFPCNYCDKSFSRKDALKRHRLVKGCGENQPSNDSSSGRGGLPPPGSVLSDTTSDGGSNDIHNLR